MKIIESNGVFEGLPERAVVSIGNFDGMHIGHQEILKKVKSLAEEKNCLSAAITFDPHPIVLLRPEHAPDVLSTTEMKTELIKKQGMDLLVILKDSIELLNMSPKDFVDQFLMVSLSPAAVVEGPNFNFGYGRSGNLDTLRELGATRNFDVHEVPFVTMNLNEQDSDTICSSSTIRRFLEEGKAEYAAKILTRPYRLVGPTVKGRGIGRKLGYPTANIHLSSQLIPAEGVYVGRVQIADTAEELYTAPTTLPAALSIGRAKTFVNTDHSLLIEAHIIGKEYGDLYGKYLAMDFIQWLRPQQRFESKEQLIQAIESDCQQCCEILKT